MAGKPSQSSHSEEGSQLPSTLTISKFAAARGKEIEIMKKTLSAKSGTKLAFQKLPKHMRRRAMSHNVKRLPRRLREIHVNQRKKSGGLPPKQKRPSRKYRRRPYNLMSDYMRRQRAHKWLNTHIWHAKRFHMVEKWGYKLPDRPCDRAFRACYRASVSHCLLQDISYYNCIEITGDYNIIIDRFKKITNPNTGLTIAAKSFIKGCREGNVTVFGNDENKKALGAVYFNWKPSQVNNKHVLWIWVHVGYYSEMLNTLVNCFDLKLNSMETGSFNEVLSYTNYENIELKELKLELNRFRLTGPLSNSVLQNCFHVIENDQNIPDWIRSYGNNSENLLLSQREYWDNLKNISSPSELPPHMILSLMVRDPRFHLPKKRTKALPEITNSSLFTYKLQETCADGPIWDSTVRKIVKESKISNAQLAKMRKDLLVPGSDLEEKGVPIPVMLIQRPGKRKQQNVGYGSGWDLIIPADWAQPIWISLIMWGARAGGLRESNSIAFHMDEQILYPDTTAGIQEENFISNKCKETFFKLPPNKRTNYNKFKIASPMEWNWNLLLSEWNESQTPITDFFVLRNKEMLRNLQELLTSTSKKTELPSCSYNCLVPVGIRFSQKGLCKQFAIICLPKEGDVIKTPKEENYSDKNEKIRKEIRSAHKSLLKRLRRRRIRSKKNGKIIPIDLDILKNYTKQMRKLWLPEPTTIRHSCSREVIGFVKHGDFNFLLGQTKALGYIAFSALAFLMSLKFKNKVLVRNTNSRQYRLGTLEILSE